MNPVSVAGLGLLGVAALLTTARLLRPGSVVDRMVAVDTLIVIVVSGLALHAGATGNGIYLDVMVALSLLGFTGTTLVARLIESRGS